MTTINRILPDVAALSRRGRAVIVCAAVLAAAALPAAALSEIKPDDTTARETTPSPEPRDDEIRSVPLPPPAGIPSSEPPADDAEGAPAVDEEIPTEPAGEGAVQTELPKADPNAPLPEVLYDITLLPEPVRRMRDLLLAATKTGDIEKLRPLVGTSDGATQLSFGDAPADPIAFLKEASGDGQGHEILAILEEILQAGYVHLDAGKPEELYVWPYFFAVPLERLTAPQRVELFRIVTAGDFEEMKAYGAYIFYRVGIAPDGRWAFFVAGD